MKKHTILFLSANPSGSDPRAIDREARAIQAELERSGFRDRFELVTRWAAERLDLLRELRKLKPTVVHFSGHGVPAPAGEPGHDGDGSRHGLFFQGSDGRPQLVTTAALEEAFGAAGSSVKLVVLSACYSDVQAEALLAHVDCVVGMGGTIVDDAARNFAVGFYGGLGERESVAAAYKQGRAAISLEGLPDGDRPQLKVRTGVDANQLIPAAVVSSEPSESLTLPDRLQTRERRDRMLIAASLVLLLGVLAYAGLQERRIASPSQKLLLRATAAISAAACFAFVPYFRQVYLRHVIRAGGAMAILIIVWLLNPASLVNIISTSAPPNADWLHLDEVFAHRTLHTAQSTDIQESNELYECADGGGAEPASRVALDVRVRNSGNVTANLTRASLRIAGEDTLHAMLDRKPSDASAAAAEYKASATYRIPIHGEASVLEWPSMILNNKHPSEWSPLVRTIPVAHVLKPGEVDRFIIEICGQLPRIVTNASLSLTYNGTYRVTRSFWL